ncbi:MAG: tetratricopeptide repeat protein, partial [Myxococcota bacterium]
MKQSSFLALVMLVAACTAESSSPELKKRPTRRLGLALTYAPGDGPTDRRIARHQAQLKDELSMQKSLALARLFMQRRRETSAPILMTYAKDAIDTALSMEPHDYHGIFLLGMVHQYEHRFERAAQTARSLIATRPDKSDAYHLLGDALLELGRYNESIDAYQAAMDRRPDLRAYNRAAYMTWLHGDASSAIRLLDVAIDTGSQRDPEASAWCFVDLGEIYRHQGDARRAIAAANRALALQGDYVPALTLRARSHALAGDALSSLSDYDRVFGRLPTVETLLEAAELLERQGRSEASARRRRQAEALAETDPRPFAHDLARRNVRTEDAVKFAKLALERRQG